MSNVIHQEIIEQHGIKFLVEIEPDSDTGAPWENQDILGDVTDWEMRSKHPSERVLNQDRGSYRFYDFQSAMKKARKEFGNTKDAVRAVEREFSWLRDWCRDEWSYVGVIVTVLDEDGSKTEREDALWGVEDNDGYPMQVAQELAMGLGIFE
jgi:hypothetical protein